MIEPADNHKYFEKKLRSTANVARVERELNSEKLVTADAVYFRVYFTADKVARLRNADDKLDAIDAISARLRKLGATELTFDGDELLVAYK